MIDKSDKKLKLLHVVRRYGPVGGMERYVWELTHELRDLGHQVEVLCEVCLADKPHGIIVRELGTIAQRPRWLALLRFGNRVARWLAENQHPDWLIHSHERLSSHHLTTFHGPPFATVRDRPWWRKVSLRVAMQLYLERRELETAKRIVPNSLFIRARLAHYYPELSQQLTEPIVPGVTPMQMREPRSVPSDGGVIGFVGQEWQRKGLPLAVEIAAHLRRTRPNLQLWVAGPAAADVQHLFAGWQGGYRLLGWSNQAHFADFDVLLHPAKAEPYGMVISEAMAARVPVVISDVCGAAAQVSPDSGAVLPLAAPPETWAGAVEEKLRRLDAPPQFVRSWNDVAREYETTYREYLTNRS
ncbi:MAG: glycosyltransferase family 4 protein [Pseudomonadota bacterium]